MKLPQRLHRQFLFRILFLALIAVFSTLPVFGGNTTQQLTCAPCSLPFGAVAVGQTQTQVVVLANTGQTSVTVSAINLRGADFGLPNLTLPLTVGAGQSVALQVSFSPTASGLTQGGATITSDASNSDLELRIRGTGAKGDGVVANPSSVSFGSVLVGQSSTLPVVLTNTRSAQVTLSALKTTGNGFAVSGPTLPLILNGGQSVTFNLTFTPQSAVTTSGSVLVSGATLNIPLSGIGTQTTSGQLSISPSLVSFGDVAVGTTVTQPITMSATGSSVTVSSDASSDSQFVLNGASLPFTISAGQSVAFNLAFTPKNSGTTSGSLTFISNASDSKLVESLTGNGTIQQHSVTLSWNQGTDVAGYNVYRSTSANGTYAKINSTLDLNTTYTDGTVASGATYFYEATALNSSGQESVPSTPPVVATIP